MKNKIIVTGATGYLGSHMCVALLERGYEVIGIDDFSHSDTSVLDNIKSITGKNFEFYECDLCSSEETRVIVNTIARDNYDIDAIIHFAGFKSVPDSVKEPLSYYYNNLMSTIQVCNIAYSLNIESIIFSSSSTIYTDCTEVPFREVESTKGASSPYGWTKFMSEQIIRDYCIAEHKKCINLRYFNPVGSHPSGLIGDELHGGDSLMPKILEAANEGKLFTVYGTDYITRDGSCIRDYIHVSDLIEAHIRAIEVLKEKIYIVEDINIGTGKGFTVKEMVNTFTESTGMKVNSQDGDRRAGDPPILIADLTKAQNILGWSPKKTLSDMCLDSQHYYEIMNRR